MTVADSPARPATATPILDGRRGLAAQVAVYVFVVVPLLALLAAVPRSRGAGGWAGPTSPPRALRQGGRPALALAKGFWHSHTGWLFDRDNTNADRFTPDLLADRAVVRIDRLFVLWSTLTLVVPALLGGLLTWS